MRVPFYTGQPWGLDMASLIRCSTQPCPRVKMSESTCQTSEVQGALLDLATSAARPNASEEERREALRCLAEALANGWLVLHPPCAQHRGTRC